jgi:predicted nucleic acid-binding protein
MAMSRYLADKSALVQAGHPVVGPKLRSLITEGLVATCTIVDLEVLFSARTLADYEAVLEERRALPRVVMGQEVLDRAVGIQHELAKLGKHRVPIPDLLVGAAAASAGLAVLHYDRDFETIADVADVAQEWVAPRGSL